MFSTGGTCPFTENLILSRLQRPDYEWLRAHLEPARLPRGCLLYEAGERVRHVYFLTGGMVSLLAATTEGETAQVAMVGREGAVGVPALLGGGIMPYQVMVQLPATALRVNASALAAGFRRGGHLQDLLLRYLHTLITQITQSALCHHYHTIEERLCRWLLISRDGAGADRLVLTQQSLAYMLGSQRTGVTAAATALQRKGLISYRRGNIHLLDRQGLERRSCECYQVINQKIDQYLAA